MNQTPQHNWFQGLSHHSDWLQAIGHAETKLLLSKKRQKHSALLLGFLSGVTKKCGIWYIFASSCTAKLLDTLQQQDSPRQHAEARAYALHASFSKWETFRQPIKMVRHI